MAYPTEIAALQTVSISQTLEEAGHVARHNELKTALESIRTFLGDSAVDAGINTDQFFYLGANGSTISNSPTDPFGVSPMLDAYGVYEFSYFIGVANSSSGAITMGWAGTSTTKFFAEVVVDPLTNGTAPNGLNPFFNTTNKAITGGNTAATYWIMARGIVVAQNAQARFPLNIQVASGNLTPQAGSYLKFRKRGTSASGTGNVTIGNVA